MHQSSALSPYVFSMMMDEVTKEIPWFMIFEDDIVFVFWTVIILIILGTPQKFFYGPSWVVIKFRGKFGSQCYTNNRNI